MIADCAERWSAHGFAIPVPIHSGANFLLKRTERYFSSLEMVSDRETQDRAHPPESGDRRDWSGKRMDLSVLVRRNPELE
jgi:hypothetical protein